MADYRVNLDIYNGPLDLLLYLIRRDEIDVHDIPVARITGQYCAYIDTLKLLDPDMAGEFLVMAATLLEIKTRMLLPTAPDEDGLEAIDPRSELVRQLLEYKAFKDAASSLRDAADLQSQRYARQLAAAAPGDASAEKDLEDVQIWDLVEAFNSLLTSVGQGQRTTEIIYDDTPIELHAEDIVDRLKREGAMTFRAIFAGRTRRSEMIGLFLAMLELTRRRRIAVKQEGPFGEIFVELNTAPPPQMAEEEQPEGIAPAEASMDQASADAPPPADSPE
jgi:segregation and condensation protein A